MDLASEIQRFRVDVSLTEAGTPPDSWYIHPDFLKLEQAAVFSGNWLCAGRVDQVAQPGDFFTGSIVKRPYVVTRSQDGVVRAFYNVCRHHGTCVAKGQGKTELLVCPYHGWSYALDGQLKKAPRAGAIRSVGNGQLNLKPIAVDTYGPFVWLCFGTPRRTLAQQLENMEQVFPSQRFDGLTFVTSICYEIHCNWKVFVDNYLDGGYHVPHMHPDLAGGLNLKTYQSQIGSFWSVQRCASNAKSRRLGEDARYIWVYPNFMINRYGPWMDTNTILPLDIDRCMTIFDYYYEGTPDQHVLERALTASDQVQKEDMEICDMVQAGLESGAYDQGVYAPRFEAPMHHFHKLMRADFQPDT